MGTRITVSRNIDGRRVRLSRLVYDWPKREIARLEDKMKADLRAMQLGETPLPGEGKPGRATLEGITRAFLDHSKLVHRSAHVHEYQARPFLAFFGHRDATAIKPDDVTQFVAWRRKQKSRNGNAPVSPATVDRELSLLRRVYEHAIANGRLDPPVNPARRVPLAKMDNRRTRIVSDDELAAVLDELNPTHRAIFLVARFTGLRKHDVLALTWERVSQPVIAPPPADDGLYETTKRFGTPPVPDGLFDLVPWPDGAKRKGRIFAGVGDFRTAMDNAIARAGVAHWWFHDLRRTFTVYLRNLRVDYFLRMVITGHAVPREMDTHQRYEPASDADILAVGRAISADPTYQYLLDRARHGRARNAHARNYAKIKPE